MSEEPAFWRFLPDEPLPDREAIDRAAAQGSGALARTLREARRSLGGHRAAALLREARSVPTGSSFVLLVVATFQARVVEDAFRVAFAIAGYALELRAVDGFASLRDLDESLSLGIDMTAVLQLGEEVPPVPTELLNAVAGRTAAPVVVFRLGVEGGGVRQGHVETLCVPFSGTVTDSRFERTFGTIPGIAAADRLADAVAAQAARLKGSVPKLIVTDLDGTLWRGTLGEDGSDGLQLNIRYAEALLRMSRLGFVLAVASRNEPSDIEAVFERHPEWPIGRDDFATVAAGWSDKASLVSQALDALGLASAHAVLMDDDPVNCAAVAVRFTDMDVRLIPEDVDHFADSLADDPLLAGTAGEGEARGQAYRSRAAVEQLRADVPDLSDFLRRLRSRLTVVSLAPETHRRAAELAVRVNQFIATDYRPNALELGRRRSPLDFMVRLDDAFGAHGLVGLVLAHVENESAVVDNVCLSCRALARGVEDAMLAILADIAASCGLRYLRGTIETLPRNEPARKHFSRYRTGDDGTWAIALNAWAGMSSEGLEVRWETATI